MANSQSSTRERIYQEYQSKLKAFTLEVEKLGDDVKGIPAPHIPIAGNNYDLAQYRIAFVGMETYGWEELDHFLEEMDSAPYSAILACQDWLNPKLMLNQSNPVRFWGFIIRFLEKFYKIDHHDMMDKRNPNPVLTSIVWAETNSIERYHVTAEKRNVPKEIWHQVKELSKPIDSINHLINATKPKVIIITDKWVDKDYILHEESLHINIPESKKFALSHQPDGNLAYQYYYLPEQGTHVFVIPHPRWIGMHGKTEEYIDSLIKVMAAYKIWPALPEKEEDWEIKARKFTTLERYKFVSELADFLVSKNITMSGIQLAELLNTTGFRAQGGGKYKTKSSRPILTRIVQPAWQYYYKNEHQYQKALNISMAFTDKYGNLAWRK